MSRGFLLSNVFSRILFAFRVLGYHKAINDTKVVKTCVVFCVEKILNDKVSKKKVLLLMAELWRSPVQVGSLCPISLTNNFIHPRWLLGIFEPSTVSQYHTYFRRLASASLLSDVVICVRAIFLLAPFKTDTLPETNIAPENGWLEY